MSRETAEWFLLIFMTLWFFALGSTIGSFLNVVIYRLPLGLNLSKPPSRCPDCETPIEFRDNIPVLGWLKLCGRCRVCRTPISFRYPLVEATIGLIFVILMLTELHTGGANLPLRGDHYISSLNWISGRIQPDLFGMYIMQCLLMCTLIAGSLIVFDGERLPPKLFVPIIFLGIVLPVIWPGLHPVAVSNPPPAWLSSWSWNHDLSIPSGEYTITVRYGFHLIGIFTGCVGFVCGMLLGIFCQVGWRLQDQALRAGLIAMLGITGLVLGWQAAISVTLIALLLAFLFVLLIGQCLSGFSKIPFSIWIAFAVMIQIVFWKSIYEFFPWQ